MKTLVVAAFFIGAAVALLAGCDGSQQLGSSGRLTQSAGSSGRRPASTQQFIYVADHGAYGQTVRIYSYPTGKLKGRLTGFGWLYGDCADSHGDVFIVNAASPSTIIEYPPGGKTPIQIFYDTGYTPTGCSVDPRTGNLAVANYYSDTYTSGTVAIFAPGNIGRPLILTDPNIFSPRYCGYDANGNLYLDGYSKTLQILFAELPAGSTQFKSITLNQTINEPGDLQWDGHDMAIGDSNTNVIYQFSMNGGAGTEVGSTTLGGVAYNVTQFWIGGSKVVGAAAVDQEVGIWRYPEGGSPLKLMKQKGKSPIGVAVSSP